ncbi:MAG TPA: hypothetical protein VLT88_01295, partial [Desulfosarcina sp.]|nr:hypothetical protein [Desulfosarcina sp.]
AMGMPLLCAVLAWAIGRIVGGSPIRFPDLWKVFATGAIPVLLLAGVPYGFFFTEPWRWLLVGLGMIHGLGVGPGRTILVLTGTCALTALLVLSILKSMAVSA